MSSADLDLARTHYQALAASYDAATRRIDAIRNRAIAALELRPGDRVLDAACGTGWCIPQLATLVGSTGAVIGFDASGEMLEVARRRAGPNVRLIHADALEVELDAPVDAILFSYTHDMLQSPAVLDRLLAMARPGSRVVATSTKLYARWLFPANWYLRRSHRGYITDFDGFAAPWRLLAERLEDFSVSTGPLTQHYIARGRVPARRHSA